MYYAQVCICVEQFEALNSQQAPLYNKVLGLFVCVGAVHEEFEEAGEENKEHDCEGHCDDPTVLLLVDLVRASSCGIQCGSGILSNHL